MPLALVALALVALAIGAFGIGTTEFVTERRPTAPTLIVTAALPADRATPIHH